MAQSPRALGSGLTYDAAVTGQAGVGLLLEGDTLLRPILLELLEDFGLRVVTPASVEEAIASAADLNPRLVVAEGWAISGPRLTHGGRERLEQLAARAPVVLLTTWLQADRVACSDLRLGGVLVHPFDLDDLASCVRDCVARGESTPAARADCCK